MRSHVSKSLTAALAIIGMILAALISSGCATHTALQPAMVAASEAQPAPTEQVFRLVPPIPLPDGSMYDGSSYVTQEEAEAALGRPIHLPAPSRLPADVTIKHFELQPALRAIAVHYTDSLLITLSVWSGTQQEFQDYIDFALRETEAGRGNSRLLEINGTQALGHEAGVFLTDLGYQEANGSLTWMDGDTMYVLYTSTWPLEELIALAETMIGPPEE